MDSTTVEALSVEGHRRAQIAEAENAKLKAEIEALKESCQSGLNQQGKIQRQLEYENTKLEERHTKIKERLSEVLTEVRWYEIHCPPGYALRDCEIEHVDVSDWSDWSDSEYSDDCPLGA